MYFYYSLTHETQLKTLILKLSDPTLTTSLRGYAYVQLFIYNTSICIKYRKFQFYLGHLSTLANSDQYLKNNGFHFNTK